jgi:hypothetical protein
MNARLNFLGGNTRTTTSSPTFGTLSRLRERDCVTRVAVQIESDEVQPGIKKVSSSYQYSF